MLKLKAITKSYATGDSSVEALKGVDIEFRSCEFVSILGPSGCGKTTLLNIIGGLDQYTSGDLSINGVSTKYYKDRDWDNYRNHSIGFVFQSYNLIPHQSVLSNVELALTISGISKEERRKRAIAALEKVGLGDQLKKKPSQMSGGQMQRVAIARAIVNDPEILLADEPTGALDTETSVQVMDILKEISMDRLVIMVTHNPELAEKYSTRIIKLLDGAIISDSAPYTVSEFSIGGEDARDSDRGHYQTKKSEKTSAPKASKSSTKEKNSKKLKKNSMSHKTAISLSFNNLLTKKGRTFMTSFAGSIGIIGIALILALSSGIQGFIDKVQRETLSTYPLQIASETVDYSGLLLGLQEAESTTEIENRDPDAIYSSDIMGKFLKAFMQEIRSNDLGNFKEYIENNTDGIKDVISAIDYDYDVNLNVYSIKNDKTVQVNPSPIMNMVFEQMFEGQEISGSTSFAGAFGDESAMASFDMWQQMMSGKDGETIHTLLYDQYELVGDNSRWPSKFNEVVIVVDENNSISDLALYTLNIKDQSVMTERFENIFNQGAVETDEVTKYTFNDLLSQTFYLAPTDIYFEFNEETGKWIDHSDDDNIGTYFDKLFSDDDPNNDPIEIKVSGIIKPKDDAVATSLTGAVAYTQDLTDYIIDRVNKSAPVLAQKADEKTDIFTGIKFSEKPADLSKIKTFDDLKNAIRSQLSEEEAAAAIEELDKVLSSIPEGITESTILEHIKNNMLTEATYESNLSKLGYVDLDAPTAINIYTETFEDKDKLTAIIDNYNEKVKDEGKEELAIEYTDLVGLLMSSISTIINIISYVLIGFVSISLIVSSIMIGIITYISVLERTKEIGILRAMGASKKDISRVFKAETGIIGLCSGLVGIGTTVLLTIPINIIVDALTKDTSTRVSNIASLPVGGAVILVIISVVLTLIGGLIPSKLAAKKDPVEALRSE